MAKFTSHLSRVRTTRAPAPVGAQWRAVALSLLLLGGAAPVLSDPALSDPAQPSETATSCWTLGAAPDLFSWSDAPGIACRDSAETFGSAIRSPAAPSAQWSPRAAGSTQSHAVITFSGNAYVGIAASF